MTQKSHSLLCNLGVEYLQENGALTDVELDHWAYGPHHVWAYPENGRILRMWQPFNGLQVYPGGVDPGEVDPNMFLPRYITTRILRK